ncbi:PREDICTED: uncharacterized protein LOC106146863 [Chinchilla lanigera]|uniref:uncharacterized protein LOC106146863 n=1 Tax=Chinchilla lanigera TaxID=34839 RepID=UPI0006962006|nr:PREDICTED: uncharacterized protein LOC106146863 [Chinchilla lanigera]
MLAGSEEPPVPRRPRLQDAGINLSAASAGLHRRLGANLHGKVGRGSAVSPAPALWCQAARPSAGARSSASTSELPATAGTWTAAAEQARVEISCVTVCALRRSCWDSAARGSCTRAVSLPTTGATPGRGGLLRSAPLPSPPGWARSGGCGVRGATEPLVFLGAAREEEEYRDRGLQQALIGRCIPRQNRFLFFVCVFFLKLKKSLKKSANGTHFLLRCGCVRVATSLSLQAAGGGIRRLGSAHPQRAWRWPGATSGPGRGTHPGLPRARGARRPRRGCVCARQRGSPCLQRSFSTTKNPEPGGVPYTPVIPALGG